MTREPQVWLTPLWLLDGLDEINLTDESRHLLIRGLERWARDLSPTHRVCLTTRPYAYLGQPLREFDTRQVDALRDEQVKAFIRRFCRCNGNLFQPQASASQLAEIAEALIGVLGEREREALRRIVGNPLLLTLTTAMYCKNGDDALPRDRAELYRICLEALLQRWEEKLDRADDVKCYSIHDATLGEAELNAALDEIGFRGHLGLTEAGANAQESGDLSQSLIEHAFQSRLGQGYHPAQVIDYLRNKTGLLLARDDGQFAFIHRSFREYLAARYLTRTDSIRDLNEVRAACGNDPGWWREVLALAARIGDRHGGMITMTDWLRHLLRFESEDIDAEFGESPYWMVAEVIANAEAERDFDIQGLSLDRMALRRRCVGWLVKLIEDNRLANAPKQREQAAITLGRLGDPRRGVGLDPEFPQIPDIDWVEIPPGTITLEYGAGEFTIERPFLIARYPITNTQFQAFVDDPAGHANREWWAGFESRHGPPEPSYWGDSNHPKTGVSWWEAVAFCRWLTARMTAYGRIERGAEIRLPTEWEWQQAATSADPSNVYPWPGEYQSGFANINETNEVECVGNEWLMRTSAVGLYRSGGSTQGVFDLAGNVWEWCINKYDNPSSLSVDESEDYGGVRGGPWGLPTSYARAAFRHVGAPDARGSILGFRVLCSPPSSGTDH